jgi:hypothetical protein
LIQFLNITAGLLLAIITGAASQFLRTDAFAAESVVQIPAVKDGRPIRMVFARRRIVFILHNSYVILAKDNICCSLL